MVSDGTKVYSWLWGMAVLYVVLNLLVGSGISSLLSNYGSILITLLLFAFALIYGATRYGWRSVLILFAITAVLSWTMETLSIATGFPFGHYVYTDNLGPKLGTVPLLIMPAYFANGFLAWTISHILLNNLSTGITRINRVQVPVIAAFVMVMWDFCIDPVTSTIDEDWVWRDGGHYFGVPISNYFGWYLTVFLIYSGFVLYLRWNENRTTRTSPERPLPKRYWFLAPVMFFGTATLTLIHPFVLTDHSDIYWSMFLAAMMTMVFVSILAILLISRFDE